MTELLHLSRLVAVAILLNLVCACGHAPPTIEDKNHDDASEPAKQDGKVAQQEKPCDLSGYRAIREVHFAQRAIVLMAKPVYPPEALRNGEGGQVNVDVVIRRDGSVVAACPLNGPASLQPAAQKAALACKFKENFARGSPVKHEYQRDVITFFFIPNQSERVDEKHYIVVRPTK